MAVVMERCGQRAALVLSAQLRPECRAPGLLRAQNDVRQRRSQAPSVLCSMPAASPSSLAPLPKGRELPACEWARCHPRRWECEQAARGTCMCPAVCVKQTIPSRGARKHLPVPGLRTLVTGAGQAQTPLQRELPLKLFFSKETA